MKPISILGRAIILVAVPSLVLLGLLAAFTAAQRHQAEAQQLSLHTTRVLESSQQLVAQLVEAQSGIRGFVIARDAVFLAPYREAQQSLPVLLEHVRTQTRDNPEQHARAVSFSRQATDVLAYYEGVLAAADAGALTLDGERSVVVQGKARVDEFKAAVRVFRDAEQRLDSERRDAVIEARSRLLAVVVVGTGAALFAVIALGVWFHRSISQRVQRLTATARALSHGNAAPADETADELGAVDVALREMAAALASRQRAAVGALADAVSLFSAAASRRAVLDVAADRALALAGAGVSLCTLVGELPDSQAVVAAVVSDRHPSPAPAAGAPFTWDVANDVMKTGRPVHLTELDRRERTGPPEVERVLGSGEWIGVPLSDDRHTPIGVLQVASLPGQMFRPDDGDVVGMLAQAASVALELQRSRQRLESLNADLALTNQENELFIYSVSHDLRSPLVNLEGFSRELTTAGERLRALLLEPGVPDDTRNRARADRRRRHRSVAALHPCGGRAPCRDHRRAAAPLPRRSRGISKAVACRRSHRAADRRRHAVHAGRVRCGGPHRPAAERPRRRARDRAAVRQPDRQCRGVWPAWRGRRVSTSPPTKPSPATRAPP